MLLEPTMYLLLALAEKAAIEPRLYGDEEDDISSEEENENLARQSANLESTKEKLETCLKHQRVFYLRM